MIRGVVSLRRSGALSVCRPSPATVTVDFASGRLVLHRVVKLFGSLVVVASYRCSEALSIYRLSLAAMAVEFALGHLMLLSNRRSCIRFVLLSCRVIWSFCRHCFVAVFWHSICVNVS